VIAFPLRKVVHLKSAVTALPETNVVATPVGPPAGLFRAVRRSIKAAAVMSPSGSARHCR
jgi:hypothetical protein